jgi:hypothetical protein
MIRGLVIEREGGDGGDDDDDDTEFAAMKDVEVEISSCEKRKTEIIRGVRKRIALVFQSSTRLRQNHSLTHTQLLAHPLSQ